MVHDVEAVNRFIAEGKDDSSNSTSNLLNYEYIAYVPLTSQRGESLSRLACVKIPCSCVAMLTFSDSTVPNQPAGAFWAVLNRLLIIFQIIVLILSEIGWPSAFFDKYFPVLGSEFGLGALGVIQCLYAHTLPLLYM